jgi:hypothetical protein
MLRTSRCLAGIFFQLGGPDALLRVARHPYQFRFADFSFAPTQALVFKAICQAEPRGLRPLSGREENNLRGNLAAPFAATIG